MLYSAQSSHVGWRGFVKVLASFHRNIHLERDLPPLEVPPGLFVAAHIGNILFGASRR
jgi:hypothetical protein